MLGRAAPRDSSLEGSALAYIYNPVFIGSVAGATAWLDFAGGGMAALEDRFAAASYFEFIAFEHPDAVSLLHLVHTAARDGISVASLPTFAQVLEQPRVRAAERRAAAAGFDRLMLAWSFSRRLAAVRSRARRLWPESFDELQEWLGEGGTPSARGAGVDAGWLESLGNLAVRRLGHSS